MRTKSNIEKAYWESVHDQATDNYPAEVSISGWTFVCEGAVYSQLMAVIHQDVVRKLFDTEQEVHDHLDSRVRDGAMGEVLRARMRVVYVRFTASAVIVEEGKPTLADLCRAVRPQPSRPKASCTSHSDRTSSIRPVPFWPECDSVSN